MKINLKEKISKVKQIKSPESAMENPEQTMDPKFANIQLIRFNSIL